MQQRIISREDVRQVLVRWHKGEMSSADVHNWAGTLYPSADVDYVDWDGEYSVTNELLAALDSLDTNLAIPEDAPIYLEFLSTPAGQFDQGYAQFRGRLDAIDYDTRKKTLRHVPLYSRYVKC